MLQPVLLHFQVQHAHAAHQGLPGLGVHFPVKRRVLALEHRERVDQLLFVGRRLGLDGSADDGLGKLDGLQENRVLRVAERVAGDRFLRSDDGDDVTGVGEIEGVLAGWIGVHVIKLGQEFLRVPAGVVNAAIRLGLARVNAKIIQLAVRVGLNLEHQCGKRLARVRLAALFLIFLGVFADHRRPVQGAGQIPANRVEQQLDADVLTAGAAEHGLDFILESPRPDQLADCFHRDRPTFEISAGDPVLLVGLGENIEEFLPPALGGRQQRVRDRRAADDLAVRPIRRARIEVAGLHRQQVDDAGKRGRAVFRRAAPDRNCHGNRPRLKPLANFLDGVFEVSADDVHLVDEDQPRHGILVGLPPDCFRLRLDAFLGVEHDHAAVQHAQRALDFRREIDVAWRVDEIDRVPLPGEGHASALDGDAFFLFQLHPVGLRGAFVHAAQPMNRPGVIEEVLGSRGFAGIDVSDDADVANQRQVGFTGGHSFVALSSWPLALGSFYQLRTEN